MSNLRDLGRVAEDRAADYLLGLGYTLVTRRYKARHGELDLVALDGDLLVFVEVKRRDAPGYRPEDSIGPAKRKALVNAARQYRLEVAEDLERPIRFDLIAIDRDGLRHHTGLFEP
jgi:putative endonuclease